MKTCSSKGVLEALLVYVALETTTKKIKTKVHIKESDHYMSRVLTGHPLRSNLLP